MKVVLKVLIWVLVIALVLFAVLIIAVQVPTEFRDFGKGGLTDLINFLRNEFSKGTRGGLIQLLPFRYSPGN